MNVKNLTVTTSGWDDASKSSDANLSGIRLLAASGDLTNVTVDGISHPNGSQGGRAIYVDNRLGSETQTVNITDATVTNYQKNGIDVRGDVNVTVSDSVVGAAGSPSGAPQDSKLAANAIVIGFGASGTVRGSHITGNDWDGLSSENATGVLAYSAGDVTIEHNVIDGAGTDVGVYAQDSDSVPGAVQPDHQGGGQHGRHGAVRHRCLPGERQRLSGGQHDHGIRDGHPRRDQRRQPGLVPAGHADRLDLGGHADQRERVVERSCTGVRAGHRLGGRRTQGHRHPPRSDHDVRTDRPAGRPGLQRERPRHQRLRRRCCGIG